MPCSLMCLGRGRPAQHLPPAGLPWAAALRLPARLTAPGTAVQSALAVSLPVIKLHTCTQQTLSLSVSLSAHHMWHEREGPLAQMRTSMQ